MVRRAQEKDPWDEALVELVANDGAVPPRDAPSPAHSRRPPSPRAPTPRGPDTAAGWLLGRDPATLPARLALRTTLVLAGAWFVLLPVVVGGPSDGDRPTWAWVLLGLGTLGALTTMAALVGRWRTAPVLSGLTAVAMLVSGVAAATALVPLGATVALIGASVWAWTVARRPEPT